MKSLTDFQFIRVEAARNAYLESFDNQIEKELYTLCIDILAAARDKDTDLLVQLDKNKWPEPVACRLCDIINEHGFDAEIDWDEKEETCVLVIEWAKK